MTLMQLMANLGSSPNRPCHQLPDCPCDTVDGSLTTWTACPMADGFFQSKEGEKEREKENPRSKRHSFSNFMMPILSNALYFKEVNHDRDHIQRTEKIFTSLGKEQQRIGGLIFKTIIVFFMVQANWIRISYTLMNHTLRIIYREDHRTWCRGSTMQGFEKIAITFYSCQSRINMQ